MPGSLLGKIASEHVLGLRKEAAPATARQAAKPPMKAPAAPKKVQPIRDSHGGIINALDKNLDLSKSKEGPTESWVPRWPKGKDITTGP